MLQAAEQLTRKVRRAAQGPQRMVLGFAPGLSVAPLVREWAALHPEVTVELQQVQWYEQGAAVREGRVQVAVCAPPRSSMICARSPSGSSRRCCVCPPAIGWPGAAD